MTGDDTAPTTPIGQDDWIVEPGDSMASIADQTGHFWQTIWNDPANSDLKDMRNNPHVLMPGDKVTIPELTEKQTTRPTDLIHRFKRKGVPVQIKFTVATQSGKAFADKAYTLSVGKRRYSGRTDPDGKLEHWVAPAAKTGKLVVQLDTNGYPKTLEKTLHVGFLQPVDTQAGVSARLRNLGFLTGRTDETALMAAVRSFQNSKGLDSTGTIDQSFMDALLDEHGN